jgi:hypothetical protein
MKALYVLGPIVLRLPSASRRIVAVTRSIDRILGQAGRAWPRPRGRPFVRAMSSQWLFEHEIAAGKQDIR